MSMDTNLNAARRKVQLVLKDQMKLYLSLMGSWFKGKLSKEEFDTRARDLFTDDTVRVHNEFLLSMLNRCQSVANTLGSRDLNRIPRPLMQSPPPPLTVQRSLKKKPFVKMNISQRFQPANQLRQVKQTQNLSSNSERLTFASSDHGLLPDAGMIEGRLYVAAWEAGLDNVQNDIYTLVSMATENILKNVISHVLSCRRGYRVSRSDKMKHYVGLEVPAVYLQPGWAEDDFNNIENSLLNAEHIEAESVQSLARAGHMVQSNEPITALDMFTALKADPDILPSFAMYTLAMERLSTRLYHPDQAMSSSSTTRPSG